MQLGARGVVARVRPDVRPLGARLRLVRAAPRRASLRPVQAPRKRPGDAPPAERAHRDVPDDAAAGEPFPWQEISRDQPRSAEVSRGQPRSADIAAGEPGGGTPRPRLGGTPRPPRLVAPCLAPRPGPPVSSPDLAPRRPHRQAWNELSDAAVRFLQALLCTQPRRRASAWEALAHPFLHSRLRTADSGPLPAEGKQPPDARGSSPLALAQQARRRRTDAIAKEHGGAAAEPGDGGAARPPPPTADDELAEGSAVSTVGPLKPFGAAAAEAPEEGRRQQRPPSLEAAAARHTSSSSASSFGRGGAPPPPGTRSAEISRGQPRSAEISRDQPRSAEISRDRARLGSPSPHALAAAQLSTRQGSSSALVSPAPPLVRALSAPRTPCRREQAIFDVDPRVCLDVAGEEECAAVASTTLSAVEEVGPRLPEIARELAEIARDCPRARRDCPRLPLPAIGSDRHPNEHTLPTGSDAERHGLRCRSPPASPAASRPRGLPRHPRVPEGAVEGRARAARQAGTAEVRRAEVGSLRRRGGARGLRTRLRSCRASRAGARRRTWSLKSSD